MGTVYERRMQEGWTMLKKISFFLLEKFGKLTKPDEHMHPIVEEVLKGAPKPHPNCGMCKDMRKDCECHCHRPGNAYLADTEHYDFQVYDPENP